MSLNSSKFYAFFAFFILIFTGCADESQSAFFNGYVEGDYLYVAPSVSGRIVNLSVKEGVVVQKGEPLFEIESAEALANLDAAKANIEALEAELADLSTGKRPEEIERINAELKQAKSALWIAEANYERAKSLLAKNAVSQKEFDAAKAEFDRANALVSELNAALKIANLPARSEQITSLKAKIKAAEAQERAARWRLEQTAVLAPKSGLVEDIFYKTGEFVQSSQPVLSLLPPGEVKIRFFVPAGALPSLREGQKARISCEGCTDFTARIVKIASAPEYAPPVIYNQTSQSTLVYLVEAVPENNGNSPAPVATDKSEARAVNAQNISAQIRRLNLDEILRRQNLNARGGKIYGTDKAPSPTERKSNLSGSNLANEVKAKFSLHKNSRVNFSSANLPLNLTNAVNLTASRSSNLTPNLSPKPQSGDYAIDVSGLTKKFGKKIITDGIDIRVKKGSVCGFLGPNGSGKTTTIRMLCGLLKPDGGSGSCLGYDFRSQSEAIRLKTGYMTQKFGWYDDLSVRENLEFITRLFAVKNQKAAVNQILDRLDLTPRQNHLAGSLSGGWKQRLALAMCLVHDPELLLLDEPTAGVDPKARREFWDIIHELAQGGITVLVSTHYMDEAERCRELIYIAYGKILARGTQSDIIASYDLNVWELSGDAAGRASGRLASNSELSVSAFGNSYHVTAKDAAALQEAVKALEIPRNELSLRPIKASLEDVFIHLLELHKDERF